MAQETRPTESIRRSGAGRRRRPPPEELLGSLDRLVEAGRYESRSHAVRSGVEAIVAAQPNQVMQRVLAAPVTTRIRGVPSELALGGAEGLPVDSVASWDNLRPVPRALLVRRLGTLGPRVGELCRTAAATLDC